MDRLDITIGDVLRRVAAFTGIARWLWLVNMVVMIVGIIHKRYDIAAIAAFTWMLALVATALGRAAFRYLDGILQALRSS